MYRRYNFQEFLNRVNYVGVNREDGIKINFFLSSLFLPLQSLASNL